MTAPHDSTFHRADLTKDHFRWSAYQQLPLPPHPLGAPLDVGVEMHSVLVYTLKIPMFRGMRWLLIATVLMPPVLRGQLHIRCSKDIHAFAVSAPRSTSITGLPMLPEDGNAKQTIGESASPAGRSSGEECVHQASMIGVQAHFVVLDVSGHDTPIVANSETGGIGRWELQQKVHYDAAERSRPQHVMTIGCREALLKGLDFIT